MNVQNDQKLLPCTSCGMFRIATPKEIEWLGDHFPDWDSNINNMIMKCSNCTDKEKLQSYIDELKSKIKYLNDRVTELRNIRLCEEEIDDSVNQLTNQFDSLYVGYNDNLNNTTKIESFVENITVSNSVDSSQLNSSSTTSIWDNITSVFDDAVAGVQNMLISNQEGDTFSKQSSASVTMFNNSSVSNISSVPNVPRDKGENNDELHTELSNTEGNEDDGGPVDITDGVVDSQDEMANSSPRKVAPSKYYFSNIKLLVIGDENLESFNTDSVEQEFKPEDMFKVACPNALLGDLVETTKFYLDKFPSIDTVIFHGGIAVMKRGKTTTIKALYTDLIDVTRNGGVNLVISCPFPNALMSNETFSRTASVNWWLNGLKEEDHMSIVSNFESFWGKPGLIYPRSYKLTAKGAALLASNIKSCLC